MSSFVPLVQKAVNHGIVTDEDFLAAGFPADKLPDGSETHRNAGISQENQQRAKSLAHPEQRRQRMEILLKAEQKQVGLKTESRGWSALVVTEEQGVHAGRVEAFQQRKIAAK